MDFIKENQSEWKAIGNDLRVRREKLGISIKELSEITGTSETRLRSFEKGEPISMAKHLQKVYELVFENNLYDSSLSQIEYINRKNMSQTEKLKNKIDELPELLAIEIYEKIISKEIDSLKDLINASWGLYEKQSDTTELLIDFIQQKGLEEELINHVDGIAKTEQIPAYKEAAEHFQFHHQLEEDFIMNNYECNKEMLEDGSTFLLEDSKPLINKNESFTTGDLPIILHDELMVQKRKYREGLPF